MLNVRMLASETHNEGAEKLFHEKNIRQQMEVSKWRELACTQGYRRESKRDRCVFEWQRRGSTRGTSSGVDFSQWLVCEFVHNE